MSAAARHVLTFCESLIQRACRGLPEDVGEDRAREWSAELPVILTDPDVRFTWVQYVRALLFAAGVAKVAHRMPRAARSRSDDSGTSRVGPVARFVKIVSEESREFVTAYMEALAMSTAAGMVAVTVGGVAALVVAIVGFGMQGFPQWLVALAGSGTGASIISIAASLSHRTGKITRQSREDGARTR